MVRSASLLVFSLLFTGTAGAEEGSFDMPLPEIESPAPSSDSFVGSFEKDSSSSAPSKSYKSPEKETAQSQEEAPGVYESAFTSYKSKKSSEEGESASEEWQKGLEKRDNFDLESLSFSNPVEAAEPVQNRKMPQKAAQRSAQKASASRGRAPASTASADKIPMPEGMETDVDAALDNSGGSVAPVSAKDRKKAVMQTISDNYPGLKTCYVNGLKNNADMKGKVVMGWRIDSQGHVSNVEVLTSQLNNKQVEKCMAERLATWQFPRQAKLQGSKDRMTYAFQFISEKE